MTWSIAAAGVAGYVASVAKEVTYVTLADGRRQERSLPLSFKMLLPFVGNLENFVKRPSFATQHKFKEDLNLNTFRQRNGSPMGHIFTIPFFF